MVKAAFNNKKTQFTSQVDLNLKEKLVKYGAETWTLQKVDQKHLGSLET
jgi:hypothetical protein